MRVKRWGGSRIVLSLLLSAAMVMEPAAAANIVYAEENEPAISVTEVQQTEDVDTDETLSGNVDEGKQGVEDPTEADPGSDSEQKGEGGSDNQVGGGQDNQNSADEEVDNEGGTSAGDLDSEEEEDNDNEEIQSEEEDIPEEEIEEQEDVEETDDEADTLNGFTEMPSTYHLTSEQMESKRSLAAHKGDIRGYREGLDYVKDEVVTRAESQEEAEMIAEAYNADIAEFEYGVLTLKLDEDTSVAEALEVAADVEFNIPAVWPNYYRYLMEDDSMAEADIAENDDSIEIDITEYELDELAALGEEFSDISYAGVLAYTDPYLQSTSNYYQYHHTVIGSSYAWAEGYTGAGVKVAVLDSGVATHNDLPNVTGINSTARNDNVGHGTHVAGIIAAKADGKLGVGVAPGVELYSYNLGEIKSSDIIAGIVAAGEKGVDLINMSIGGLGYSAEEQAAIDQVYQKGIAVFASAGNDGGQTYSYPACYNHVISVAATDKSNERASFSTYNSKVDLSAPGVAIWSANSKVSNAYVAMSGTSMACPVAVGEAAVILGSYDSLKKMEKNGARVDALEKLMKANVIKAGSGMGSGITSLTKVFKLSTAATKPNAPTITATLSEDKQSVKVTITAQAGMKLCYTTNGKNPVWKNETADANTTFVGTNTVTIPLDCSKTAKGTVKAFAINSSGVTSAVKSLNYTLKPYVTKIEISGSKRIEQGKSVQLAAAVTPSYATNKKVTWELYKGTKKIDAKEDADYAKEVGVSISTAGKVTATKTAQPGKYTVKVTAQDDGKYQTEYTVEVVAAGSAIQSLAFDKTVNKELWITKSNTNPTLSLSTHLIAKEKNDEGTLVEIATAKLGDRVTWTSSKPAVATVDAGGKVTAVAAGTTTITAKANDSGNKKVTVNITVKQAVTDITITDDKGAVKDTFSLAAGKSMTLKAVVNPAKPTNKKVVWSIDSDDPNISINASSGKITVKAGAEIKKNVYTVTATAADGKDAFQKQKIRIYSGAIGGIKLDATKATLYTKTSGEKSNTATITATITGAAGENNFDQDAYTITSSNESIVKVSGTRSGNTVTIKLTAAGGMYGKANVVIASTDGSNKKATCAVTVSGGITKAELQDKDGKKVSKLTLFRNVTASSAPSEATLNAVLEWSDGANMDAYEVTSSNPSLVTATLSRSTGAGKGKITLKTSGNSTGKATITLTATDGSKKKATCTVTVVNPASGITIAPSAGNNGCVAQGKTLQLKATVESEYGALSNKNVTWELYTKEGTLVDKTLAKSLGMSIASNGKVTATKNAKLADGDKPLTYTVKAIAKDGSGVAAAYTISLASPAKSIDVISGYTYLNPSYKYILQASPGEGILLDIYSDDLCQGGFTVSSSNPAVMSVTYTPYSDSGGSYINYGQMAIIIYKKGSATITIKAMDGSGKQVKYNFVVK